ncbi:uncharacterized protein LOC127240651 [Andrographis paniculata]|uniref:uncharacterized protein LOC127240651 n=1 Tax=Andrographis paniculata TaxID=175694 RepID=UPI0021E90CE3|nr:uncharacterized protein LOC127240651 [Andrographis paniculata]XP_051115403.1 uncharacterized protein LOC127240651 [Andrographis paniculata]XP_051115404.1 uncharacterized protein LOC127240651 [Andrographis paniculata]
MEDKKLNFNRPLLSVRRTAPTENTHVRKTNNPIPPLPLPIPSLPPNRPELKSGPITNPGSVPFLWERAPGQPKKDIKIQAVGITVAPIGPKLPPGRYNGSKNQPANASKHTNNSQAVEDQNAKTAENRGATMEEKASDSVDSDGEYEDALDSLSKTDASSFFNCRMSELDGLDDGDRSGEVSVDLHNQALMMDRFLPAAKAMALEAAAPPLKKPLPKEERPPPPEKQRLNPSLRYGHSFTMRYSHCLEEEEEEDDDQEDDRRSRNSRIACGLLLPFCSKSSFGLINSIQAPLSSARKWRRGSKIRTARIDDEGGDRLESLSTSMAMEPCTNREEARIECPGLTGKGSKTFQELLAEDTGSHEESDSGGSVVEKTLYIDAVHKFESKVDPSLREGSCAGIDQSEKIDLVMRDEASNDKCTMEMSTATYIQDKARKSLAPPLPKSPADSWLGRALPYKSTKSPTLRSYLRAESSRNCGSKAPAPANDGAKWETLVKTTRMQQVKRQLHHSEGFMTAVPET